MKKLCMLTLCSSAVLGAAMMTEEMDAATWMPNSVDTIKAEIQKQKGDKQQLAVYRVQKGDTLSGIAEVAGLTINQILEMNDIPNPNMIHIGQLINLGYSSQANNFVAQKGRSVQHNQKEYHVPTAKSAQQAMNSTKQTVASKPTNQYKLATPQVSQAPVQTSTNNGSANKGTQNVSANQSGSNNQTSGGTTQTPTTNNCGSQTSSKPSNGGQTTNQPSSSKPSTGGNTNTGSQQGVNAATVDKTYRDSLSNDYGWKGQWMDSKEGWENQKDYDQRTNGYAEGNTWSGDKNPNQTLGKNMADATDKQWKHDGDNLNDYKYGYTHTTVTPSEDGSDSTSHTDYYFWN